MTAWAALELMKTLVGRRTMYNLAPYQDVFVCGN
jgi:hypothetical protein